MEELNNRSTSLNDASIGGTDSISSSSTDSLLPNLKNTDLASKLIDEVCFRSQASEPEEEISDSLQSILKIQKILQERKSNTIVFSPPILFHDENPVIYPHTINLIQGQTGCHKSRFGEYIGSALIRHGFSKRELLHLRRNEFFKVSLCLVDSERNHMDQLPYAIQNIIINAGFEKTDDPYQFDYISLLSIDRKNRFAALEEYLEFIRKKITQHIFIILDVATDCIEDFNRVADSMRLIDLMNQMINQHDVTFLCIVHENPGSTAKARGHFGTEVLNKASTAIQVGFEKDANGNDSEFIRIKYLKCRMTKKHPPFYVKYCDIEKGLVLADEKEVINLRKSRQSKASEADIVDFLEIALGIEPMKNNVLVAKLCADFIASPRTINERLKSIMEGEIPLMNSKEQECILQKKKEGKEIIYFLSPIQKKPDDVSQYG